MGDTSQRSACSLGCGVFQLRDCAAQPQRIDDALRGRRYHGGERENQGVSHPPLS